MPDRPLRTAAPHTAVAAALLTTIVLGAGYGSAWTLDPAPTRPETDIEIPPVEPPAPEPLPTLAPPPDDTGTDPTRWLLAVLITLAVILLALGITAATRHLRARRPPEKPEPLNPDHLDPGEHTTGTTLDVPALADAVEQALTRLDAAATPTDAVVQAWVMLEEAAAEHGWERHPSQTSTEFTTLLLGVSPAPPEHTATLRRLYQRARFTTHPVGPQDVARARTALEAIRRSLTRPAADLAPGSHG